MVDWLSLDNLSAAWERVADNRGAPGVDHVGIARFARNWEENLRRLRELVPNGHNKPARLRRVAVPKRGGGQRLHHVLEGFGTPVPYSVFECLLDEKGLAHIKRR